MDIVVISLKESVNRRASIRQQFREAGLDHRVFDAIARPEHLQPYFADYDESAYLMNTGRLPTPGEIGCYASHLALWKECIEHNEPMVILEDDAMLMSHFGSAVQHVEELIHEYGFLRLQTEHRSKEYSKIEIKTLESFRVYRYERFPYGAVAYAISPKTAGSFVQHSGVLRGPVDVFIKRFWEHGHSMYGLLPYPVTVSGLNESSAIGGRARDRTIAITLRRAVYKSYAYLLRAKFNMGKRIYGAG